MRPLPLLLLLLLLAALPPARAQMRYGDFERDSPWLTGVNAAGVRCDTVSRSVARLRVGHESGALVDRSGSDNCWQAGAATRSVRHLERISFFGGFGYDYFDGRNMSGSMFIRPGYYPVDLVEFTPGRKIRECYDLTGGVAVPVGERWVVGLRADFTAANYAKRKDLRHKNKRLDVEVAPGILYRAGRFAAGAALRLAKNSERIEAEEVGSSAASYEVFLDKGLAYGIRTQWESGDLHLTEEGISGFPVREMLLGGALQLSYGALFVEGEAGRSRGETGEKGVLWHTFEGEWMKLRAVVRFDRGAHRHRVRASFGRRLQLSRENILVRESEGNITTTRLYGSMPLYGRRLLEAGLEDELFAPRTELRATLGWEELSERSTLIYPEVRRERLRRLSLSLRALRRFGRWELLAAADVSGGDSSAGELRLESDLVSGSYPDRQEELRAWEVEYRTAPRLGVEAGLRCNIGRCYVDLAGRYERGFALRTIPQPYRLRCVLSGGVNF